MLKVPKAKNLKNVRFGKLLVVDFGFRDKRGKAHWNCICDCGVLCVKNQSYLINGNTKSCGCIAKEHISTLAKRTVSGKHSHNFEDITGSIFGYLTVVSLVSSGKSQNTRWECKCRCGSSFVTTRWNLVRGDTKSCGCLRKEVASTLNSTHCLSKHPLYSRWKGISSRCYNTSAKGYHNYGGRGIYMCDEWRTNFKVFYNWSLDNGFSPDLEIDRINNDGPYSPDNCRWVSRKDNVRNRRVTNKVIYEGKEIALAELAEQKNIKLSFLYDRLYTLGWDLEDALNIPSLTKDSIKNLIGTR